MLRDMRLGFHVVRHFGLHPHDKALQATFFFSVYYNVLCEHYKKRRKKKKKKKKKLSQRKKVVAKSPMSLQQTLLQ